MVKILPDFDKISWVMSEISGSQKNGRMKTITMFLPRRVDRDSYTYIS